MSHFTVIVIGDNASEQLDKYWELDLMPEVAKLDYRAEFDLDFTKEQAAKKQLEVIKEVAVQDKKQAKEYEGMSVDEFMGKYFSYEEYNKEEKGYGYYFNRDAKWDWLVVGGRWFGYFRLKKGAKGELGSAGVTTKKEY